jgi:serine/threonine protein kinase
MVEATTGQISTIDSHYICVRTLGKGATSKVKLCKKADGKLFALKVYDLKLSKKKTIEIVRTEAKSYNWLKHPHIVKCIELKESAQWVKKDGRVLEVAYMALEYISGGELFYYVLVKTFAPEICRYFFK